ncbi:MAG: hypothetical protein COA62_08085 [Rhodobiaceae bacterium]|nr:MAG: hypothetical protein COA62_08085 [Rhodobiaceae bacterium]
MRRKIAVLIDLILAPVTFLAALYFKLSRRRGFGRRPASSAIFRLLGVLPISDHYYEPLFIKPSKAISRALPGLDLNENGQLEFLEKLVFADEITDLNFDFSNNMYASGDADFLFQMVRHAKPKHVIEIGAGKSTQIIQLANAKDNQNCEHICIEPYEASWLENMPVTLIREKVEDVGVEIFGRLEANDILFIDSSHIIRPGGDVLFKFLSLLPTLASGVLIHIHDIFTPFDYSEKWQWQDMRLWNEQYLLEAFLSHNSDFEVVAALAWLKQTHPELLSRICPMMAPHRQPGAFWIRRK